MRHLSAILLGVATCAFLLTLADCADRVPSRSTGVEAESPPTAPDTSKPTPYSSSPLPPGQELPVQQLPAQPPADTEQIYNVGGDVTPPERISGDGHDIAALVRSHRIQSVIILQAVITEEGRVKDVRLLKLDAPELAEPIEKAVKSWRFEPATLHGKPVAVYYNMTIHIRLQ